MQRPGPLASLLAIGVLLGPVTTPCQDSQMPSLPEPIPPPAPDRPPPEDIPEYESILDDSADTKWTIPEELLEALERRARIYQASLKSFVCEETVRRAEYTGGSVDREHVNVYSYLLAQDPETDAVRESRREFDKKGQVKSEEVQDEEPFPPAYEWVFLFSSFNQPMFAYRHVAQRLEGFDVVHEIEFKGALPFTDGRDIRQWEGKVLVDAFTYTPLSVLAEPNGQEQRIRQMFEQYNRSFNVMGMRTGKKPDGHRALVRFGFRKQFSDTPPPIYLTFPTSLRYDTQRAVGPRQMEPLRASTRNYAKYRFFKVDVGPEVLGEVPAGG
jgi:hypothetical protein